MTTETTLRESIEKAFITALLLSGDIASAEAAVLTGIERMSSDDQNQELLQNTVEAAIGRETFFGRGPEPTGPLSRLPLELRRVLRLPHFLRQCFVLRVLAGLPREVCAHLLNLHTDQVDQGMCAAMQELPWIQEKSFATHSGWNGSNN